VAQNLIEIGFKKVYALRGGWKEWSESGYPVEGKSAGAGGSIPGERRPSGDMPGHI
jgi:3-mercaptopyruvate sulfurtransferase SseA